MLIRGRHGLHPPHMKRGTESPTSVIEATAMVISFAIMANIQPPDGYNYFFLCLH